MNKNKIYIISGIIGVILISSISGCLYANSEEKLLKKAEERCGLIDNWGIRTGCFCDLKAAKNNFTGSEYKTLLKIIPERNGGKQKEFLHSVANWKSEGFDKDTLDCVIWEVKKEAQKEGNL